MEAKRNCPLHFFLKSHGYWVRPCAEGGALLCILFGGADTDTPASPAGSWCGGQPQSAAGICLVVISATAANRLNAVNFPARVSATPFPGRGVWIVSLECHHLGCAAFGTAKQREKRAVNCERANCQVPETV